MTPRRDLITANIAAVCLKQMDEYNEGAEAEALVKGLSPNAPKQKTYPSNTSWFTKAKDDVT